MNSPALPTKIENNKQGPELLWLRAFVPRLSSGSPHSTAGLAAPEAGDGLTQLLLVSACLSQEVAQPASGGGQAGRCAALQVGLVSFLGQHILALPAPDLALQDSLAAVSFPLCQQLAIVWELWRVVFVQHFLRVGGFADAGPERMPVVSAVRSGESAHIAVSDVL